MLTAVLFVSKTWANLLQLAICELFVKRQVISCGEVGFRAQTTVLISAVSKVEHIYTGKYEKHISLKEHT